jgi:hypothetical protein
MQQNHIGRRKRGKASGEEIARVCVAGQQVSHDLSVSNCLSVF